MTASRQTGAALLDVNVLVALAWPNHVHHRPARRWFESAHQKGWATTPVTESGFVRVSSDRSVIVPATTPELAIELLTAMTALAGHVFWPDDVRLVVGDRGGEGQLVSHRDVTDAHLLALADARHGRLVTFDVGISRLLGDRPAELVHQLGHDS